MTLPKQLSRYNKHTRNVNVTIKKVDLSVGTSKITFAEAQGMRDTMEDAACVYISSVQGEERVMCAGVFDGHGGALVAKHMEKVLCKNILGMYNQLKISERKFRIIKSMMLHIFKETDRMLHDAYKTTNEPSGCTAIVLLVDYNTNDAYYVNLGDSKGIAYSSRGELLCETIDHKPNSHSENRRITQVGGKITKESGDVHRINNILSLSRALGDHSKSDNLKYRKGKYTHTGPVSCVPDVYRLHLKNTDVTFVLACDGIWDVLSAGTVMKKLLSGMSLKQLIHHAIHDKKSTDNVTVLKIRL